MSHLVYWGHEKFNVWHIPACLSPTAGDDTCAMWEKPVPHERNPLHQSFPVLTLGKSFWPNNSVSKRSSCKWKCSQIVACCHLAPIFLLISWWQWQTEDAWCVLPDPGPGQSGSFLLYLSPEDFSWLQEYKIQTWKHVPQEHNCNTVSHLSTNDNLHICLNKFILF